MSNTAESSRIHYVLLLLILIAGTIIRFWDYRAIPFTHDELSMMSRLQFHTFSELIEKGVKPDGHPAGVQVFVWYWVKVFGQSEFAVKFPFMFMGVLSIYLGYLLGKKWFSVSTGLLTAAYLSGLQYSITTGSMIARPYATGLFLSLLLLLLWTNLFFPEKEKQPSFFDFLWFTLVATLNCYNHHFSLMFTGIIVLSGWILWKRIKKVPYLLACISIGLLYLPHLSIFLFQLNVGGIGWLAKPDIGFFLYYLEYIFHFSALLSAWTVLVVFWGIILYFTQSQGVYSADLRLKRRLLLSWFLIPLIIGYLYSIYRSPVLQASLLIFSFPCFLLWLFSFGEWKYKAIIPIIIGSLFFCFFTLITKRQHFNTMYHQPFKQYHSFGLRGEIKPLSAENRIFNVNPDYLRYYDTFPLLQVLPFRTLTESAKEVRFWKKYLDSLPYSDLIIGGIPREYYLSALEKFPYILNKEEGFTYEIYHLSKNSSGIEHRPDTYFLYTSQNQSSLEVKIDTLFPYHSNLEVALRTQTANLRDTESMTVEIWQNNKKVGERKADFRNFADKNTGFQTVFMGERLRHIFSPHQVVGNFTIKVKTDSGTIPEFISVKIKEGNPLIYALLYNIN